MLAAQAERAKTWQRHATELETLWAAWHADLMLECEERVVQQRAREVAVLNQQLETMTDRLGLLFGAQAAQVQETQRSLQRGRQTLERYRPGREDDAASGWQVDRRG